jgi:hypothetical protein
LLKAKLDRRIDHVLVTNFGLAIRREPLTTASLTLPPSFEGTWSTRRLHFILLRNWLLRCFARPTPAERAEKLLDYESLGVPEVWVVSPEAQTVEVLLLQDGHLSTTTLLRQGQLKPTRFPEAAVDVSAIWLK